MEKLLEVWTVPCCTGIPVKCNVIILESGQISPGSVSRRLMAESVISSFLEISCSVLGASAGQKHTSYGFM